MPDIDALAIIGLAVICAGGLAYALIYPFLSGAVKADERREAVAGPAVRATRKVQEPAAKRPSVEETLKEMERRQTNANRPSLSMRIAQAGLSLSKGRFMALSGLLGIAAFGLTLMAGLGLLWALAAAVAASVGVPQWFLAFMKKRRLAAFLEELANAVDVIVRGVKAGLPLGDCLRIVATEAQEPVRSEFRYIIEQTALGIPLHEAVLKLYERMPVPEANFFCIVISIQQKAGGNLAEGLANLSKVLRDRKKMKNKIIAMSQEAKASAAIIASLPPGVMIFVYLSTPQYISLMWTTEMGRFLLAGCLLWMFIGAMVMRKMINFDF
ncbi:type II secretion system F family protein [Phreatobacter sp. AB_2022a]|uniref:type II secretion system F family protein n=1 Tax=Phreatobacter sp. AB_2022a TaxID=3003134 RepID=UPI002287141C|nr:type II secretion system F family protein [Phreatobacter sp. AB_2022a]MCZ0736043.1 type II secretion system F family protein [Phreatobacter sp. AB_2022a]